MKTKGLLSKPKHGKPKVDGMLIPTVWLQKNPENERNLDWLSPNFLGYQCPHQHRGPVSFWSLHRPLRAGNGARTTVSLSCY